MTPKSGATKLTIKTFIHARRNLPCYRQPNEAKAQNVMKSIFSGEMPRVMGPFSFLVAAVVITSSALADEVWETPEGDITYLADEGSTAVFGFHAPDGEVRFYFPGLVGNFENRGLHTGYWIKVDDPASNTDEAANNCGITMTGLDGFSSAQWGTAKINFTTRSFPSDITIIAGACAETETRALSGIAAIGG